MFLGNGVIYFSHCKKNQLVWAKIGKVQNLWLTRACFWVPIDQSSLNNALLLAHLEQLSAQGCLMLRGKFLPKALQA